MPKPSIAERKAELDASISASRARLKESRKALNQAIITVGKESRALTRLIGKRHALMGTKPRRRPEPRVY